MSATENRLREDIVRFGRSLFERGLTAAGVDEFGNVRERGRAASRRYAERADGIAVSDLGVQLQGHRHAERPERGGEVARIPR